MKRHYYDMESGNYYLRNRYYSPFERRFLTEDPHGINPDENWNNPFDIQRQYSDGCGLQVYAQGDPVNNRDGWGLTTIIEYRNLGPLGHAGLLVDGRDIDFGPLSNITNEWVYAGISPWERSDGNNDQTGPDPTANRYNLTMSRSWLRKMDAGPKKGVACCKLTLKNAAICVKYVSREWDGSPYLLGVQDCRTFVWEAATRCCLAGGPSLF